MKNTYKKPVSQSISLLFSGDVADQIVVGSNGQSGDGNYTHRHNQDWTDDFEDEDFVEE